MLNNFLHRFGMCTNESDQTFYQSNSFYDVDSNSKIFADYFSASVFSFAAVIKRRETYQQNMYR